MVSREIIKIEMLISFGRRGGEEEGRHACKYGKKAGVRRVKWGKRTKTVKLEGKEGVVAIVEKDKLEIRGSCDNSNKLTRDI